MRVVEKEALEKLAAAAPSAQTSQPTSAKSAYPSNGLNVSNWLAGQRIEVAKEGSWNKHGYRWVLKECPWNGHSDKSAYIVQRADGSIAAGCHHNSCQGYGWKDLRAHYEPGYRATRSYYDGSPTVDSLFPSAAPGGIVAAERKLRFITAKEISEQTPKEPEWICRPYVAKGAITDISGKPKSAGKTTFVSYMIHQILLGGPFLNYPTTKTNVVYLTEQSHTTFREVLDRADLLDQESLSILFWTDSVGVSWEKVVESAVEEASRIEAGLLVVDTLPQFAGLKGDAENNAGAALGAVQPLQSAASQGLAVVSIRHDRKSGGEVGESARGSGAFSGAVDVVLSLRRREGNDGPTNVRVIGALSRFDETPEQQVIELRDEGYISHGSDTAFAQREAKSVILESLPSLEETAWKQQEIVDNLQCGRTVTQQALKELEEEGAILKTGKGVRGDPHHYFRPAATTEVFRPD